MDPRLYSCSSPTGLGAQPERTAGSSALLRCLHPGRRRQGSCKCETLSHCKARNWRLLKTIKTNENPLAPLLGRPGRFFTGTPHCTRHTVAARSHYPASDTRPAPPSPSATPFPAPPPPPPAVLSELAHTAHAESSLLSRPQILARKINSSLAPGQPHVTLDRFVLYAVHQMKPGRHSLQTAGSPNPLPGGPWHSLISHLRDLLWPRVPQPGRVSSPRDNPALPLAVSGRSRDPGLSLLNERAGPLAVHLHVGWDPP